MTRFPVANSPAPTPTSSTSAPSSPQPQTSISASHHQLPPPTLRIDTTVGPPTYEQALLEQPSTTPPDANPRHPTPPATASHQQPQHIRPLKGEIDEAWADAEWTKDRVSAWLARVGWNEVDHIFRGSRFLSVSLTKLHEILPKNFKYAERRTLLNHIRAIEIPAEFIAVLAPTNGRVRHDIHDEPLTTLGSSPVSVVPPNISPTTPSRPSASSSSPRHPTPGLRPFPTPVASTSGSSVDSNGITTSVSAPHRTQGQGPRTQATFPAAQPPLKVTTQLSKSSGTSGASSATLVISPRKSSMQYTKVKPNHADWDRTAPFIPPRVSSSNATLAASSGISQASSVAGKNRESPGYRTLPKSVGNGKGMAGKVFEEQRQQQQQQAQQQSQGQSPWSSKVGNGGFGVGTFMSFLRWPAPQATQPRRQTGLMNLIQVTQDRDVWYSLDVTDMLDADEIRDKMFQRLRIVAEHDRYGCFHIGGEDPGMGRVQAKDRCTGWGVLLQDTGCQHLLLLLNVKLLVENDLPLSHKQLVDLCRYADDEAHIRVHVRPVFPLRNPPTDPWPNTDDPQFPPVSRYGNHGVYTSNIVYHSASTPDLHNYGQSPPNDSYNQSGTLPRYTPHARYSFPHSPSASTDNLHGSHLYNNSGHSHHAFQPTGPNQPNGPSRIPVPIQGGPGGHVHHVSHQPSSPVYGSASEHFGPPRPPYTQNSGHCSPNRGSPVNQPASLPRENYPPQQGGYQNVGARPQLQQYPSQYSTSDWQNQPDIDSNSTWGRSPVYPRSQTPNGRGPAPTDSRSGQNKRTSGGTSPVVQIVNGPGASPELRHPHEATSHGQTAATHTWPSNVPAQPQPQPQPQPQLPRASTDPKGNVHQHPHGDRHHRNHSEPVRPLPHVEESSEWPGQEPVLPVQSAPPIAQAEDYALFARFPKKTPSTADMSLFLVEPKRPAASSTSELDTSLWSKPPSQPPSSTSNWSLDSPGSSRSSTTNVEGFSASDASLQTNATSVSDPEERISVRRTPPGLQITPAITNGGARSPRSPSDSPPDPSPSPSHSSNTGGNRHSVTFGESPKISPRPSSTQHSDGEFWGERPPVEKMYDALDKYFKDHDLDQEIMVPDPVAMEKGHRGRALHKTKSIRLVANEARRKMHTAANVLRAGQMFRRPSTKFFGAKVQEMKPQQGDGGRREIDEGDPVKIQWIKGELIGKGSFGRVYHALNVATGEMIAVKQVDIPKTKSDQLSQRQTDMVKSLYHEIDLLKITRTLSSTLVSRSLRLESPHFLLVILILTVFQFPEETVNIFLEYVPGGSIASCVHKFGPPPEPVIRNFTRQILLGLEYLHEQHILHRDIKGGNVLVDEDGVCKISDFGLSKKNDYDEAYDQNSRMSIQGSVFWMAPEVVRHEPYSAKIDIWSLGCLVLEMFTGDRPWISSDQWAAIYSLGHSQPPPIPDTLSPLAKDFLKKCFIIDANKRPTAADLLKHKFCPPDFSFKFEEHKLKWNSQPESES
ncbi:hypothetical protein BC938DRAFT_482101 [Jimgerdemannia flammicorona]|uniref:Protein kinase domain-containing protein n=1 Tax=Jimgerdemannia flammicorona TaxID=994334 RepID=A0A433QES8_9FUNG|nr:hypothetical protein BC938DRAFT_482101 [Jimgerdemannia flammicorona]